ncbi:MAG: hypothetical protein K6F49_05405 [Saccharofermentans sp.]|nr:hypothetical protein [Saccharofermentans sp.]
MSKDSKITKGMTGTAFKQIGSAIIVWLMLLLSNSVDSGSDTDIDFLFHEIRVWQVVYFLFLAFVVAGLVFALNIFSIACSLSKTDVKTHLIIQTISAISVLVMVSYYYITSIEVMRLSIRPSLALVADVVLVLFFLFVLISSVKELIHCKEKPKSKYMVPVIILSVLLVLAVIYPFTYLLKEHGFTNYLSDRFDLNTAGDNDICNSVNHGVAIDDTIYYVTDSELQRIDPDGTVTVVDSAESMNCMPVRYEDSIIYWKVENNNIYFCVYDTKTDTISEQDAEIYHGDYYGVRFAGIRDSKYFYMLGGSIWCVDIIDGNIDISNSQRYAWDTAFTTDVFILVPVEYSAFIQEYGSTDSGVYCDGYKISRRYSREVGSVCLYSKSASGENYIDNVRACNVYNGRVYYVVYIDSEDSYEIYESGPDLASPTLIGTMPRDPDDRYISPSNPSIVASDTYIACIYNGDVVTIDIAS